MWTVRLTEAERDALTGLLEAQGTLSEDLAAALEEIELARWDELPDAELPWDRVAELAAAQGIGEADVVWDLCAWSRAASGRRRSRARAAAPRRR